MLHTKVCERANIKLYESESGAFAGYGSTFGNRDRVGDVIVRGAFAAGLESFLKNGFVAVGHDWTGLPVATVKSAVEDDLGLMLEADFHSTGAAQDARRVVAERLERGKFTGLSIGFRILDAEDVEDGRILKDIELHEVSIVTVPANPLAQVVGAKDLISALREGPHGGLRLEEQVEVALAAAEAFKGHAGDTVARLEAIIEDRVQKAGRVISRTNLERIDAVDKAAREVIEHCEALRVAATPKAAAETSDEARRLFADFQRTCARLQGVQ